MSGKSPTLSIFAKAHGKALLLGDDGALYRSHHWRIFRSHDDGASWRRILTIPRPAKRWLVERSRLACRALRHEVRAFEVVSPGRHVAATRTGIYYGSDDQPVMQPARVDQAGPAVQWPMNLLLDGRGRVLWSEYWGNPDRREARVFVSTDAGRSYQLAWAFRPGEIRHVHRLSYDAGLDKLWVFSGDHNDEPGIGLLDMDFTRLDWLVKGRQSHRVVTAFDFGDRLVYGTDTEKETNAIYSLEKASGQLRRVRDVGGSTIYGCRCGPYCVLSTTVEPSEVNHEDKAHIWISRDGEQWHDVYQARKDRWSHKYFQFGSLVLPSGRTPQAVLMFSAQAVEGDGNLYCARIVE